jgi:predicted PurR-regulated permease PerM
VTASERKTLNLLTLVLVAGTVAIVLPLFAPILLAAWAADLLQSFVRRLQRVLGGRRRGAAAIVVLLLLALLLPVAAVVTTIALALPDVLAQVRSAFEGRGSFLHGAAGPATVSDWVDLIGKHGTNVWRAISVVARMSASAVVLLVVFVVTLYALAASGARSYRWLVGHVPTSHRTFARLFRAFRETGRGLIIGAGGSALVQGLVATIGWIAIGVPRAEVLGPLAALCALVPLAGTALVWVPLTIELGATGDWARAVGVMVIGIVVGSIDNFVRPVLARYGKLALPTSVVLVSMLGGLAEIGPTGVLIGPLVVRLAVEALAILREAR